MQRAIPLQNFPDAVAINVQHMDEADNFVDSFFTDSVFHFTFESYFNTQAELRKEVAHLLWQIDKGMWTIGGMYPNQIGWLKEKIDKSFIKINGGGQRQFLELVKRKGKK
jgi:hypothetical protein